MNPNLLQLMTLDFLFLIKPPDPPKASVREDCMLVASGDGRDTVPVSCLHLSPRQMLQCQKSDILTAASVIYPAILIFSRGPLKFHNFLLPSRSLQLR